MMKALHFGAGNIGRGLIGYLLSKSGYEICFADTNDEIIETINTDKHYYFKTISNQLFKVDNIYALNIKRNEKEVIDRFMKADIITTSVGANNLKSIVPCIVKGIEKRINNSCKKIDIIANENAINASSILKKEIELKINGTSDLRLFIGFPNSAIDRQSSSILYKGKNIPFVEEYYEWVINRNEIISDCSLLIKDVNYADSIDFYIERKLYFVNSSHTATAYMGHLYGKKYMKEAFEIEDICNFRENMLNEIAQYFTVKYNSNIEDIRDYLKKIFIRHSNKKLNDEIIRVGREPIRKLGYNERLVSPYVKLRKINKPNKYVARAIASAFRFKNELDKESIEIYEYIKSNGINKAVKKYTKIKDKKMLEQILEEYEYIKNQKYK